MLLAKTLLQSWRKQWQQVCLVILGLLTASAGLSSVLVLNETARQKMSRLETPFTGAPVAIARLKEDKTFNKHDYSELLKRGISVIGFSNFELLISDNTKVTVSAMDSAALLSYITDQNARSAAASNPSPNVSFSQPPSAGFDFSQLSSPLISKKQMQWFVDNVDPEEWPYALPVTSGMVDDHKIYMSLTMAGYKGTSLNVNEMWFFDTPTMALRKELVDSGFNIQLVNSDTGTLTNSFYINITAMGLLMFTVSMFISLNAYNLLINGRQHLMKQLYRLGVSVRSLKVLLSLELNLLTLFCCSGGFVFGLQLAEFMSPGIQLTLSNLYGVEFSGQDTSLLHVLLIVLVSGLVAANTVLLFPFRQALRTLSEGGLNTPIKSKWQRLKKHTLVLGVISLFMVVGIQEVFLRASLISHFVLTTISVLLGCYIMLLLIPTVLRVMKDSLNPDKPLMHYFASDAVRLSNKSKIAICAFFIAITANIGMNLMVGSFRIATGHWIDQQFTADYYLSTTDIKAFENWAVKEPEVELYHRARAETLFEGRKTEIIALHENFTVNQISDAQLPLLFKTKSSDFEAPHGILINEQMSIRHNLKLEGQLRLGNQDYLISGIYYDYGNTSNQVLLPTNELDKFPRRETGFEQFSLNLKDKNYKTKQELESDLETLKVNFYSGEKIKNISLNVFDQTFLITSGLNLITLLVAGASLATSILIIEGQNRQQTRVIQQLGISSFVLWLGSLLQYLYLVTLVFLLSVPFGILLSYQLINKINYAAFQWSYPLMHDLTSYGFVYLTAAVTVLFAVSLPWFMRSVIKKTSPSKNSVNELPLRVE